MAAPTAEIDDSGPIPAPRTTTEWLAQLRERFSDIEAVEELLAQIPSRSELPREVDFSDQPPE